MIGRKFMSNKTGRTYEFGPFRLVPDEKQLLRNGLVVPLTPKCFDLLVVLVESSGHLLEKAELMDRVWRDSFVEEANLSVKMTELRRALGETPNEHQFVETVPRRGYRFVAKVNEFPDESGFNDRDTSENLVQSPTIEVDRRSYLPWLLLPVALVFFSGWFLLLDRAVWRESFLGRSEPVHIQSIAVLPLENLSGDGSEEYFADGITDALIANLSAVGALRVSSRPSVMQYKRTRKSLEEISRELNVDAVLTGSIIRSGGRVRITMQLAQAVTDRNVWANTYERDLSDVLELQKEVAKDIVSEVRVQLSPQEQMMFGNVGQVNPEAFDEYLRGQFYLRSQTKVDNDAAIRALEHAVALDKSFAQAHAELSQAYVWKLFLFNPEDKHLSERAFVSAEKALSLDRNLAVAYLARGRLLWTPANHYPHEKAIQELRRALELNPNLDEARNQLALVYCHVGAFDHALEQSRKAIETNPGNALAQFRIGQTLNFQGKYKEALVVLRGIPQDANPALVGHQIAWSLFNLGKAEEASAVLKDLLRDHPEDSGGVFTSVQAVLAASKGNKQLAKENIRLAIEKGRGFGHFHHTAYHIACAYALLNMPEEANKWLEMAADDGFPCYPLYESDHNLNNLRNSAQFIAFMAKLKEQWTRYQSAV